MGTTIDDAMEEIIKYKMTKCKDDNISDFSQALNIAFLTMKNYQILKNSYNDKLKADLVAMLEDLDLQIDESAAYNLEVAKVQRLIRDRINKLKEEKK